MDKIRPFLDVLKQYHFWALTIIVALLGLGAWYTASAGLIEQFDKDKKQYSSKEQSVKGILSETNHPNDKIIKGLKADSDTLKHQVLDIWTDLYNIQRENVLYWPDGLQDEFINTVDSLEFDEEIPHGLREDYQYFAKTLVQRLPKIVQAREIDVSTARSGGGKRDQVAPQPVRKGDQASVEENYIVIWDGFADVYHKYNWPSRPISRDIWIKQEDYWVYKNLLQIIANTNSEASGPHNAAIKVIESILIGAEAAYGTDTRGTVLFEGERGGSAAVRGRGRESVGMAHMGGRESERGGGDPEAIRAALLANRYLDDEGNPITASADQGGPVGQYRRLPIRLELIMNVEHLPELLVNCADAPLTVEPTQVVINPHLSPSGGSGRAGEGVGGRQRGGERRRALPGGSPRRDDGGASQAEAPDPAIASVVIQGIVYIYNRPDKNLLGLGDSEDSAVAPSTSVPDSNSTSS